MDISLIFSTANSESLVKSMFGKDKHKTIILDRAKIQFESSSFSMENSTYCVTAKITMLTPFGAAAISNFLQKRLANGIANKIKVGEKEMTVFNDQIREVLLSEYNRAHTSGK